MYFNAYKRKPDRLVYRNVSLQVRVSRMENKVGKKLRTLRKAKGFTTQDVANKVNVSQSYISRFENGKAIPDIEMLEAILNSLESDLATFFSDDMQNASEDLIQLMETIRTLKPEARKKLNEFLQLMKD